MAAFALAAVMTPLAGRVARATGFVAAPTEDRHHRRPTPLLGGVAILLAVLLPSAATLILAAW
ncbi:hypothetical protein LCGC14_2977380, partial [marine sediment metagenome]